ncbi:Histidinol dehydrogenase (EC 1.1.1.23) [uncultured Gammaproteobacteria bacterium]|jgi:histidinol dehydrogenase|uniref:histidinol dehydrogenase n=1 Tax=thiotrophic endosymbiont of Bathymodiolus puteoserpentis (Logatchev) TaxID=343240 RepID=UPI0010B44238|nr:histidinol dehydrogenase [thiotrophic endosymbiont of Bathymodiolus puteoserpentis (Logatchev)]CAC9578202.1 Histidinol dehydrogenase (EC 1.1.1.23) [uncultured Gammaproteobacteria bacterium]CAC9647482.1 Histidinol dehydrogenase (EC 1.1.1.23) [uncultured Gammaproteobacteria bacterium]CAC9995875.1 Histidinol dehydrogenase (EC 1.1.1.23) [uncultured Gammaproteobacteria bacterium]SSC10413.1 Histidinol dehydrogenase [thiotrophic endosymbiont of Bathymodiolus puteoserpentis (Logatchev)]
MITNLSSTQSDFQHKLSKLLAWESVSNKEVVNTVDNIIANIKAKGDAALIDYSIKFDGVNASSMADLTLDANTLKTAFDNLDNKEKTALQVAADRVRTYHEKQKQATWTYREDNGTMLGQKITPIERVGLYVPGGKAAYPSSVLMNAIPARVAGVNELIMVVPTPNGITNPLVLAAAYLSGVDSVYTVGGAQAVAALAYGTETVPKVDKIVGPGNIYVATAKRAVFGQVGIDMIAGPSEILIICDGKTNPDWIAMDLFSQAEHDEDAQSILLCPDADFIAQVEASIAKLLPTMNRKTIIAKALKARGALIHTKDMAEAITLSNQIAPEHLELSVEDPESMLDDIKHAGAIFMGRNTCESLGDYCAGPNHVLPTSGTARFSSPLGVYDFQKKSSLIMVSDQGANTLGEIAATLADGEGLQAHAQSARYRIKP